MSTDEHSVDGRLEKQGEEEDSESIQLSDDDSEDHRSESTASKIVCLLFFQSFSDYLSVVFRKLSSMTWKRLTQTMCINQYLNKLVENFLIFLFS